MELSQEKSPKPELYRVELKIQSLQLNTPPKNPQNLFINFNLPNSINFEESVKITKKGPKFGPRKTLTLPLLPPLSLPVEISLTEDNKTEIGKISIPDIISNKPQDLYDIINSENQLIGKLGIEINDTHLGPSFNQFLNKGKKFSPQFNLIQNV